MEEHLPSPHSEAVISMPGDPQTSSVEPDEPQIQTVDPEPEHQQVELDTSITESVAQSLGAISDTAESNGQSSESNDDVEQNAHPTGRKVPVRTSGRIIKRPNRDIDPPPSPPKKTKTPDPKKIRKPPGQGQKRPFEVWTNSDSRMFYEAIVEQGRDFDSIHQYFLARHRKKPESCKTKEQIRFYYYRASKKAMKYTKKVDGLSPKVFELFCVINYGEFFKKGLTIIDEKRGQKLNELIYTGNTIVRVKRKYVKLKTPTCKALQKLHHKLGDERTKEYEDEIITKLPGQVTLCFFPKSSGAWSDVQDIAQNPRLRVKVKPGRRLSSVFDFLESKWRSKRQRAKEKVDHRPERKEELFICAAKESEFSYYDVKVAPPAQRRDLSLTSYVDQLKNANVYFGSPMIQRGGKKKARSQSTQEESNTNAVTELFKSAVSSPALPKLCTTLIEGETIAMDVDMAEDIIKNNQTETSDIMDTAVASTSAAYADTEATRTAEDTVVDAPPSSQEKSGCDTEPVVEEDKKEQVTAEAPEEEPVPELDPVQIATGATHKYKDNETYILYGFHKQPQTNKAKEPKAKSKAPQMETIAEEDKTPWMLKLDEKIITLREGVNKKAAEEILVGDVWLLMGSKSVFLSYDWVDPSPAPDVLDMGSVSSTLRRLVHVAQSKYVELSATPVVPREEIKTASKEVQVNTLTAKDFLPEKGSVNGKRGNKNPSTPRAVKPVNRRLNVDPNSPSTSPKSRGSNFSTDCGISPLTSPPPTTLTRFASTSSNGSPNYVRPVEIIAITPSSNTSMSSASGDGVFKMPTAVPNRAPVRQLAPKPQSDATPQSKPEPTPTPIMKMEPLAQRRRAGQRHKKMLMKQQLIRQQLSTLQSANMVPLQLLVPNATNNQLVMQTPGNIIPLHINITPDSPGMGMQKELAKTVVMDPMQLTTKAQCRRIIPTPAGAVTGDKELTIVPQEVIEDSAQNEASLQNVMVSLVTTTITPNSPLLMSAARTTSVTTMLEFPQAVSVPTFVTDPVTSQAMGGVLNETDMHPMTSTIALSSLTTPQASMVALGVTITTTESGFVTSSVQAGGSTPVQISVPASDETLVPPTTQENMISSSPNISSFLTGVGASERPGPAPSPSISQLLGISMAPDGDNSTDKMIDLALENSTQSLSGISVLLDAAGNSDGTGRLSEQSPATTQPSSSTLAAEDQWLGGQDFNLSRFLDSSKDGTSSREPNFLDQTSRDGIPVSGASFLDQSSKDDSIPASGANDFFDSFSKASGNLPANFLDQSSKDGSSGGAGNYFDNSSSKSGISISNFLQTPKDSAVNFHTSSQRGNPNGESIFHSPKAGTLAGPTSFLNTTACFTGTSTISANIFSSTSRSETVTSSASMGPSTSSGNGSAQPLLGMLGENSRNADEQMQNNMNESSLDFISRFADLVQNCKDVADKDKKDQPNQ